MDYPLYIEVNNKRIPINTDFRVAIECNRVAQDESIGDLERALAVIYLLFGNDALEDYDNYEKYLELAQKYLLCGENVDIKNQKIDMDFVKDMPYIEASFMSDFKIDLENEKMHWWKFTTLMNGLSNSELGNCCILNNIRNLRNIDLKDIKDEKQRRKIKESQERVALEKPKKHFTEKQMESIEKFNKLANIRKE